MRKSTLLAVFVAIGSGPAFAGSPLTTITIADESGKTWTETLGTSTSLGGAAGLLQYDSKTGNFTLLQGTSGQSITTDNLDSWVWQDAGYWSWHSADQVNGSFMAEMELHGLSGHGDPELSYDIIGKSNTGNTQTYTVSVAESIVPPLGGANTVFASTTGTLNATSGTALHIDQTQVFTLSAGASSAVNAGVDLTLSSGSSYTASSPVQAGPVGAWDHMQLATTFTLSGGTGSVEVVGYASVTPAVPEPDTYAMMLVGLGLIGVAARRRRL